MITLFLALLLAHLVADFVLQRDAVATGKARGRWRSWAEHGAVQFLAYELAVATFTPVRVGSGGTHGWLLALVLVHLALDRAKLWAKRHGEHGHEWLAFVIDQVAHALSIGCVAWLLAADPQVLVRLGSAWAATSKRALFLGVVYVGAICGAGHLNAALLRKWSEKLPTTNRNTRDSLQDAGLYIGWLERFLVITAVLVGSPEGAGLVAAAKSVFRFEDARQGRAFAEYFLVGTFLSLSEAVGAGLVLRWALGAH
jgi:hypothetical protein